MASSSSSCHYSVISSSLRTTNSMAIKGAISFAPLLHLPQNLTFLSIRASHKPPTKSLQASSWHSSVSKMFDRDGLHKRGFFSLFSTHTNQDDKYVCEDGENNEASKSINENSNLKTSKRCDLDIDISFKCKVCGAWKKLKRDTVVGKCGGCNTLLSIANHISELGEPTSHGTYSWKTGSVDYSYSLKSSF